MHILDGVFAIFTGILFRLLVGLRDGIFFLGRLPIQWLVTGDVPFLTTTLNIRALDELLSMFLLCVVLGVSAGWVAGTS